MDNWPTEMTPSRTYPTSLVIFLFAGKLIGLMAAVAAGNCMLLFLPLGFLCFECSLSEER